MSAIQRFQRELDGLQSQYDLLSEKIARLRQALAIETDVASRFKQEKQLEQAETERAELVAKMEALEAKIGEQQTEPKDNKNNLMSRKDDIKRLIANHERRLQKLKEQQASFGPLYAPPHILTEIEDAEKTIGNLQTELESLEEGSAPSSGAVPGTSQSVEIASPSPAYGQPRRAMPAGALERLQSTLLDCGPFDSEKSLTAVFVDERISPWRNHLPEAGSSGDRVDQLIAYLHGQYNAAGENVLLLFLRVLRDRTDPQNLCHQRLAELAGELEQATGAPAVADAPPESTPVRRVSDLSPEDEQFLQEQLTALQRNLRKLINQKNVYGPGEEPLRLLNQIEAEEKTINKIKQQLGR